MQEQTRITLIPAYEPGEKLVELAEQMSTAGFALVVVDDGSGERFREVFDKVALFATVLTHETNKGKGCALKTGLAYISENFPQGCIIVTVDADGQHSVEDSIRVCDCASNNQGSLVLGCRSFKDGTPIRSLFGNTLTKLVFRLSTGISVSDTQTGLRAFGSELFAYPYFCQERRYEYYSYATPVDKNPAVLRFASVAKELKVVLPISFYEKDGNRLFNSVAVLDADGSLLGVYRKTHIPDDHYYQEKFYFSPGDTGFRVWETAFGKIGVGICWDQWFPETARALALNLSLIHI